MELLGGHVESCSVCLEMVLVLVQDRCTVCAIRTIGSYIILEMVLVFVQDKCTVCAKRTVGSDIV